MFRSWRQSVRELGERVERLEGELGRLNMENADLKSQLKERDARIAGFPVARSTLCRAMQRLARRAKPTRDALVEALRASPVVYADETGWKQGGRRVWLWVFTNLRETVYEILPGRGFEQAASVLGKNYAGTLGVDGWAPYRCFKEATLQTCYNHLLHRCHELLETATRGAVRFPRLVKAILRHALALRDRRDAGEISPHGLRVAKGLLQAKMNRLLPSTWIATASRRRRRYTSNWRMKVPDEDILAHGTGDPLADVGTQARLSGQWRPRPVSESTTVGASGAVYGELLTFDDPLSRLPAIDRLEGFRPGGSSLYRRVLVPATINGIRELAWVYTVEATRIKRRRIVSGRWPK